MSTPPVPAADKLGNYAVLVPTLPHSIVSKIDGKLTGFPSPGTPENVTPGPHKIDIYTLTNGLQGYDTIYVFVAQAGMEYRFKDQNIVEVSDRFHQDQSKHGFLHLDETQPQERQFITDEQFAFDQRLKRAQQQKDAIATAEVKGLMLPLIRKIGARICQTRPNGVRYVGFVEGVTDDKVQIRVADAQLVGTPGLRPGGFSPSIIWDSPLNWDLCER